VLEDRSWVPRGDEARVESSHDYHRRLQAHDTGRLGGRASPSEERERRSSKPRSSKPRSSKPKSSKPKSSKAGLGRRLDKASLQIHRSSTLGIRRPGSGKVS
jgi:hypothetical protein